jgi:hypothetical protein
LDEQTREAILGLIFTGGTALGGLILVFLGSVVAAFDSYDTTQQRAVRHKYRVRARTALIGFLFALAAAVLVIPAHWVAWKFFLVAAMVALSVALVSAIVAAFMTVSDI